MSRITIKIITLLTSLCYSVRIINRDPTRSLDCVSVFLNTADVATNSFHDKDQYVYQVGNNLNTLNEIKYLQGDKCVESYNTNTPRSMYTSYLAENDPYYFFRLKLIKYDTSYNQIFQKEILKLFGTTIFTTMQCSRKRELCYVGFYGGGKFYLNSLDENGNYVDHWEIFDQFEKVEERDGTTHIIISFPTMTTVDTSKTPASKSYVMARLMPLMRVQLAPQYNDKVLASKSGSLFQVESFRGVVSGSLPYSGFREKRRNCVEWKDSNFAVCISRGGMYARALNTQNLAWSTTGF